MTMRHIMRTGVALVMLSVSSTLWAQSLQQVTIAGRAIDPQGQPMVGIEVLLHRVDGSGGASLGSAPTDSAGAFSISAEAVADTAAVYFAAARLEGQLYIGPFVRDPDGSSPYILTVGGEPVALGPVGPTAGMPPVSPGDSPRRQLLVLLPLIGLIGVAGWALARGARPPARRRTLVRIAEIDEAIAADGDDPRLASEREQLMERLLAD